MSKDQRRVKRELQIQGRKALRMALKDQAVQDHINKEVKAQVSKRLMNVHEHGYYLGKLEVVEAAFHLEYTP